LNALQDQDAAQIKTDTELQKALNRFALEGSAGITGGKTFAQWVAAGKAPAYSAALVREQQVAATVESIQRDIYGPKAAPVITDRASVNKGLSDDPYPG
jgi:hypothetical protein